MDHPESDPSINPSVKRPNGIATSIVVRTYVIKNSSAPRSVDRRSAAVLASSRYVALPNVSYASIITRMYPAYRTREKEKKERRRKERDKRATLFRPIFVLAVFVPSRSWQNDRCTKITCQDTKPAFLQCKSIGVRVRILFLLLPPPPHRR